MTPETPQLIYICAPYAAYDNKTVEDNVAAANRHGNYIAKLGHIPIIPHNYYYCKGSESEEFWKELDLKLLGYCSILYFPSSPANPTPITPGCRAELQYAFDTEMPIITFINEQNIYGLYDPDAIKNF